MTVVVDLGRGPLELASGDVLAFGREPGPGTIGADDRRVSRHHGDLEARADGTWSVTSRSERIGLVVYDHETPSRLHIPRRVGPVVVPFAHAFVVIEVEHSRHALEVTALGLDGWKGAWTSSHLSVTGGDTELAWDGDWGRTRHGQPRRWYQALVALCEPQLADPPDPRVPSDIEVADRLGVKPSYVAKRLMTDARQALAFDSFTPNVRQAMVSVAISQGLVTPADRRFLDVTGVDDEVPSDA